MNLLSRLSLVKYKVKTETNLLFNSTYSLAFHLILNRANIFAMGTILRGVKG